MGSFDTISNLWALAESRNNRGVDLNVKSGSLVAKLRLDHNDRDFTPLPGPLLRKYIAYARTYVFPR